MEVKIDLIDVWDVGTFDDVLISKIREQEKLIKNYYNTEEKISHDRENSNRLSPRGINNYGDEFYRFVDSFVDYMSVKFIRAWHYTRLTDDELVRFYKKGIEISTRESLKRRLNFQVENGVIDQDFAEKLYLESPFSHNEQLQVRANRFWLVAKPIPVTSSKVKWLLGQWGGEVANMYLDDNAQFLLRGIGIPRVLEVRIPLAITNHVCRSAEAVVNAFAGHIGCKTEGPSFDLYIKKYIGPDFIIKIHSEGDYFYQTLGL